MERRCKKIMTTGRSLKPGRINAGQDQKIEEVAVLVRQSTVRRKTRGRAKKRDPATPYRSSTSNACVLIPLQDEKAMAWLTSIDITNDTRPSSLSNGVLLI
jgi:hypothetical protein